VGEILAERLAIAFVDIDAEIVRRAGQDIKTIFRVSGEPAFRAIEEQVVAETLAVPVARVVALGGGAVISARTRGLLRDHRVISLAVDIDEGFGRVRRSSARPLLSGDDQRAAYQRMLEARAPLYASVGTLRIDTTEMTVADTVRAVMVELSSRQDWS